MRARVAGREVVVGRPGATVTIDGAVAGSIEIADTIKPEAAEAVRRLRAMGMEVWMITGDRAATAEAVAREAGIDHVLAEVLPAGKVAEIRKLQAAGRRVAMVGDGVNDAPALAQADLGIVMGSGTDVAMEAGGVTLMRDNLNGVAEALELSRRTMRIIRQNLFWAFAYNVIGIPVAALGLLSPMLASAAMALSSVTVVHQQLAVEVAGDGNRSLTDRDITDLGYSHWNEASSVSCSRAPRAPPVRPARRRHPAQARPRRQPSRSTRSTPRRSASTPPSRSSIRRSPIICPPRRPCRRPRPCSATSPARPASCPIRTKSIATCACWRRPARA